MSSTSDTYNAAKQQAEQNPNMQKATEQQIPNAADRNAHNAGVHHGHKLG